MVNSRAHSRMKSSSVVRFISRRPSPSAITFYMILLFAFSLFVFVFNARDILDNEPKSRFSEESLSQSQSQSQSHSQPQSVQMSNEKLQDTPLNYGLRTCVNPTAKYKAAQGWDRYITVKSNGGLNQMRTGISDMVAVAHIMNATLVIPQLDKRSFWQDTSTFSDIFDELHFITSLQNDVRIIKELPKGLESIPRARKHFTSWSGIGYYEEMTQLWKEFQVIHVAKSDSRLANNDLPLDIQRLRCRALYQALRFSPPIESLGKKLVERLRSRGGGYIALHLRYEKDMLSFTGCTYGLTQAESEELRLMRENTNHWKVKKINSTEQREGGFCPLTPKEVGIFLQALGYSPSTMIYIAAGEIYGGRSQLVELTSRFPNTVFKETLATPEELKAFSNHASQTAALDYIISIESDVFIPSYSGNMARAVEGHRRFLGHRKTITPDRKELVKLFDKLESGQLKEGSSFLHIVQEMHKNRQGAPRKRKGPLPGVKGRARFRTEESRNQQQRIPAAMGLLNLLLLMAMVATNILSLYHLSARTFQSPRPPPPLQVPDHLLQQLQTIRAAINHLTRQQPSASSQSKPTIPSDLLLFSRLSPIASSCHNHPDLLHKYMTYTPYSPCPPDSDVAESLILRGCHPLPRRRCFSKTPSKPPSSLPHNPFPSSFSDSNIIWAQYSCKSFSCLAKQTPNLGFDISAEISKFMTYKTELDLPIPQLLQISKSANSVIRLGIDIGGNTGTFAARMKHYNVTIITSTMNFNLPNNEVVAIRGLVPLHMPLQQRLPVFDGVVDLVRCGRAVNRWIPLKMMEFMFYDVDRVLRGGGYFWLDHFFSKGVDLDKIYGPLIWKLGYKKVKWAVGNKTDSGGLKNRQVYLTALLQKPVSR